MSDPRLMLSKMGAFIKLSQSHLNSTTQESEKLSPKVNSPPCIQLGSIAPFHGWTLQFLVPFRTQMPKYSLTTELRASKYQLSKNSIHCSLPNDCTNTYAPSLTVFSWSNHSHPCLLVFWGSLRIKYRWNSFQCPLSYHLCTHFCPLPIKRVGPFIDLLGYASMTQIWSNPFEVALC